MSRWYSSDTQIKWVCLQLLKGRELCHMDEIENVRGWRLAAIVWQLIHRYRWPIQKREGANGVAYYRLAKGIDKTELIKPRSFEK